jgi:hypothetical protein
MHLPTSEYLKQQNRHLCVRQNFPHPGQPLSLAWLVNMPRVSFQGHRCNLQFVLIPITFDYLLNPNQNTDVHSGHRGILPLPCPCTFGRV